MSTPKKPKKHTFQITEAAPDDPIYTRGYVVGGWYGRRQKKPTDSQQPSGADKANREDKSWPK